MADFKTHITTSTVLGVGVGTAGYFAGIPLETCMLGAGLCSVAGMLPDLDSDSGVPVRETMAFAAAVVPMLMIDRFQHLGLSYESMVLAGGLIYIAIRFGIAEIFKHFTVHRGMWHSIPATLIVGMLAYMICSCADVRLRYFKTIAVVLGFLSHLVLDEIWSIQWRGGFPRFKKSFGTAIKFWGKRRLANLAVYGLLGVLLLMAFGDPIMMEKFGHYGENVTHTATELQQNLTEQGEKLLRR